METLQSVCAIEICRGMKRGEERLYSESQGVVCKWETMQSARAKASGYTLNTPGGAGIPKK